MFVSEISLVLHFAAGHGMTRWYERVGVVEYHLWRLSFCVSCWMRIIHEGSWYGAGVAMFFRLLVATRMLIVV